MPFDIVDKSWFEKIVDSFCHECPSNTKAVWRPKTESERNECKDDDDDDDWDYGPY
jgi:hypothetical protein